MLTLKYDYSISTSLSCHGFYRFAKWFWQFYKHSAESPQAYFVNFKMEIVPITQTGTKPRAAEDPV
jgi:hypothetical protein